MGALYKGVIAFITLQLMALTIVGAYPPLVNYLPNRVSLTSETAPPPRNPRLQYCLTQFVNETLASDGGATARARFRARTARPAASQQVRAMSPACGPIWPAGRWAFQRASWSVRYSSAVSTGWPVASNWWEAGGRLRASGWLMASLTGGGNATPASAGCCWAS